MSDTASDHKRPSLNSLRRIIGFVAPYRWMVVGATLALVVAAGAVLGIGQAIRRVIDVGFGYSTGAYLDLYFGALFGVVAVLALCSLMLFACVLLTQTRSVLIGVVLGLGAVLLLLPGQTRTKRTVQFALIAAAAIASVPFVEALIARGDPYRVAFWQAYIPLVEAYPWSGHGLTASIVVLGAYAMENSAQIPADLPAAELVVWGGRIVTVDPSQPEVEALAAQDGRIVAVGPRREIARRVGPQTKVLDLKGALAVPGLIEAHAHFLGLGDSRIQLDLRQAQSWSEVSASKSTKKITTSALARPTRRFMKTCS